MKVAIVFCILAAVAVVHVRSQACTEDAFCLSDTTTACHGGDVERCQNGFCTCVADPCHGVDCSHHHCQHGHAHCGNKGHCVCP